MQNVHRERSAQRFGLALPITMEGEDCSSHDISATGLLVESPAAPAVGAQVSLTLQYRGQDEEMQLDCEGQVVRVERHGDSFNIAVRLSRPLFHEQVLREGGTG
jgi:hypothetical protein